MTCNGPVLEDQAPNLAELASRQETFANFPTRCPVSSSDLAQAGFFYTGEGDQVRCFRCLATLEGWEDGDSVVGKHKSVSPNCPFINEANFEEGCLLSGIPNGPPGREATPFIPPDPELTSDFEADYLLRTRQVVDLLGSSYPQNPAMCNEEVRRRSFHHWPAYAPVTPEDLANAGLYYRGVEDEVECFCCGGKLKNWEPGDQAWSEHRRHFPRCFFVLGHDVGNVGNIAHPPGDGQLDRSSTTHRGSPLPPPPHNPSMADFAKRLQTFGAWNYPVSKERLAQAGFYSLGMADGVECFCCGGGLKEWKAGEDPWEEHLALLLSRDVCLLLSADEEQLQSQAIQSALQMGFSAEEISQTVGRKERLSAERYRSVEALVTDLIAAQRDNSPSAHLENHLQKEEKLKRLEEEKICKICMDKLLSVVLIPCGHLACQECAEAVEKCPWCCEVIAHRQKVFIP
uniref:E3 ubiquitin-protein ligase XIAP n=1 Tax=Naja naja TaxID=35670 RepID=A0A8C6Y500_NAJNA